MTIASYRELRNNGATRNDIEHALATGGLLRVRRGWYATPETTPDVLTAVRCGGSVSCGRALKIHGLWVLNDALHIRVGAHARASTRGRHSHRRDGNSHHGVDDLETALTVAITCMSVEAAACVVDSALNLKLLTPSQAQWLLSTPKGKRIWSLCDGCSESGIETLARIRLRAAGLRLRVQVKIGDIGRVDLLVGDRLVIELDGDTWHSTKEKREDDRRRDSALVALGYLVIRAGYSRVVDQWDIFEREVLTVVRRRDHRWTARTRRAAHGVGENSPSAPLAT